MERYTPATWTWRQDHVGHRQMGAGVGMGESKPTGVRTLATKIDHLFRTVHPRNRGEYSLEEVAEGIRQRGGPTISANYLWLLRKGLRDNPTKKHLEALSDWFGVSPAYFFDDKVAAEVDTQLELLAALRDARVRHLALRASALSPETLGAITEMVERARQIEGVPAVDGQRQRRARAQPRPAEDG